MTERRKKYNILTEREIERERGRDRGIERDRESLREKRDT